MESVKITALCLPLASLNSLAKIVLNQFRY